MWHDDRHYLQQDTARTVRSTGLNQADATQFL
jgi:hypothetical protein